MRAKKDLLQRIGNEMNISVTGIDNFPSEKPAVIVANHTSMPDIFSVPYALPEASQIILSARLMWKRNTPETAARRQLIDESLYGIPLEVHGGNRCHEAGLAMARSALHEGWPVIAFPEGAYTGEQEVTKGRTGAIRLLFEAKDQGTEAQFLPIGIDTVADKDSLDELISTKPIRITIGEPIDYESLYREYSSAEDDASRKQVFRTMTDIAMRTIAELSHRPYKDEFIPLRPRSTIILESGEEVPIKKEEDTSRINSAQRSVLPLILST